MPELDSDTLLDKLSVMRFKRLAAGYTIETEDGPRNAGFFRDNIFDIMEELSDALAILRILQERLMEQDGHVFAASVSALRGIAEGLSIAMQAALLVDEELPPSYHQESVTRDVTREELGI